MQGVLGQLASRWPGEFRVIALACPGDAAHDRAYPAKITRIPSFNSLPGPLALIFRQAALLIALVKTWRSFRFERIVCGYLQTNGPLAFLWNRFFGVPYVVLTYGMELMRLRHSRAPRFWKAVLRRAELVTTIAQPFSDFLSEFEPKARVEKIPMGCVASEPAKSKLPEPYRGQSLTGRRVILSVGRLVRRKGFDTLISAVAHLEEKYDDLACVIVGRGPEETRLKTLAKEKGVEARVIFTGGIDDEELAQLYERADVFALISRSEGDDVEGFGLVFIEAGARGVPVVGGNSGGVAEAVKDGAGGFLVDPHDPKDVAEKISAILGDADLTARMGAEGKRLATKIHTFDNMTRALMNALEIR